MKHVFDNIVEGEIRVWSGDKEKHYELVVSDNGTGLPNGVLAENPQSFGLKLIKHLTEQQKVKWKSGPNKTDLPP